MFGFDVSLPYVTLGALTGLTYGLLAVGLVFVFRSSKFINFAQIGIGIIAAAIAALGITRFQVPYWIGFVGCLVIGAALAVFVERFVVRKLDGTPKILAMVATLGVGEALILASLAVNDSSGGEYPQPPGMPEFDIGPLFVSQSASAIAILGPVLILCLGVFLRRSRYGLAIRAASDNADAAASSGIAPLGMSGISWGIAGGVAAFSTLLILPSRGTLTPELLGPELLLRGLAAAALAGFVRLPTALAAGVGIGVVEQVLRTRPGTTGWIEILLLALILAGIALQTRRVGTREPPDKWEGVTVDQRLPPAYEQIWLLRNLGWIVGLASFLAVAALPLVLDNRLSFIAITVMCFGIVGLSVGLLTGYAGQLSLAQFAYGGVAAAVSIYVVNATGVFFAGIVVGALAAAVLSVLVGLPAIRVQGLLLAVGTLGFALVVTSWLLRQDWMLGRGVVPPQPVIGAWVVDTPREYFVVALAALAFALWLVRNVRRGLLGRRMIAVRDNEAAARALTVRSVRVKLQVYALAGAVAGLGGAMFGHAHSNLTASIFPVVASIDAVTTTAIGGLGALTGPLVGSLYLIGIPRFFDVTPEGLTTLAAAWLILLTEQPKGMLALATRARDRLYDLVAKLHGVDPAVARSAAAAPEASASSTVRIAHESGWQATGHDPGSGVVLSVQGLTKRFGGLTAVSDASFEVRAGETLGLIGPNGAGKTTLFEMVGGFLDPDEGRVEYLGRDITSWGPERRAEAGLVRSFQNAEMFPTMTLGDAVRLSQERSLPPRFGESVLGLKGRERTRDTRARKLIDEFGLTSYADVPLGSFSTGTRRMAEMLCVLALGPNVLLLDEPFAGIPQGETDALAETLVEIKEEFGLTIVIIEHDVPLLARICDRMVALEAGSVVATGTPEEVQNDARVIESYIGAGV